MERQLRRTHQVNQAHNEICNKKQALETESTNVADRQLPLWFVLTRFTIYWWVIASTISDIEFVSSSSSSSARLQAARG